ncbi:MAG: pilus assembly protein HicB [Gammaproteobacteria bacterium]|nr:pilus assembly protein HicB [Gammaproteobacteria bacterium]
MSETARYKYPLKLPASLKETATRLAKEDGVSLNHWIATAVAQKVGAVESAQALFDRRAAKAHPGAWTRYLDASPNTVPVDGDELPED